MAGYKSVSFDPDAIATASDAASSALVAVAGASDAASNALSVANVVSNAASAATVKAAAASSKIAAQSASWEALAGQLIENTPIILDAALSADGTYCGIVEAGTAGATLAFGEVIYLAVGDSRWELAKADAAATSKGKIGICVLAAAGDGSATTVLLWGKIRADTKFPSFTIAAPVFISAATAGLLTSTAPTGTTNFVVRIIGQANTADELFFCPSPDYIELA